MTIDITKVSVIVPVYQRADSLTRAIASVAAEPGIEAEIIVVDDGSWPPIEVEGQAASKVRLIRSEINAGAGAARNLGVSEASHDVLAFLDSDDEWIGGSARSRLHLLEPSVCVVGAYHVQDDIAGTSTFIRMDDDLSTTLQTANPSSPSTWMIGRDDFQRAGGFPTDRDCAEDWVFLLRALRAGIAIRALGEAVATIHMTGANTTQDPDVFAAHALGAVSHMTRERLLGERELKRLRRIIRARLAGVYANAGIFGPAGLHLVRALPGLFDSGVAREVALIPVKAVRGAARRRWRPGPASLPNVDARSFPASPILVLVTEPAPNWVNTAVREIIAAGPTASIGSVGDGSWTKQSPLAAWRVRRAAEPNAIELSSADRVSGSFPPESFASFGLVVDLSGRRAYVPQSIADPPALRAQFGDSAALQPQRAFALELLTGAHLGYVSIVLESHRGSPLNIRRVPVVIDPASSALTRNAAAWKAAATLPRAVDRVLRGGASASAVSSSNPLPGGQALAGAGSAVRFTLSLGRRVASRERWGIAIQALEPGIPSTASLSSAPTAWILPSETIADPFIVEHEGATFLFVERLAAGRPGAIAVARIDDQGRPGPFQDVLVAEHHLSYPTVFEDGGAVWLLVESASTRQTCLYRADDFPTRWAPHAVLLQDVPALDPTLFRTADAYWMFGCVAPCGPGRNDELWLFQSSALCGPWRGHPGNPIVDDPRTARPAGGLFIAEGRLIRPSQDCSVRYGQRIVLNEVLELDDTSYAEQPIGSIEPEWSPDLVATHTLSRGSKWQAVDGAYLVPSRPHMRLRSRRRT